MFTKLNKAVHEPHKIVRELHRFYGKFFKSHNGIDIIDAEWDNLLILDACRFDVFRDLHSLQGDLRVVQSVGSSTSEWLLEHFHDGTFPEITYVAGNPNLANITASFAGIKRLWETDWDYDDNTVMPNSVADRALEIEKQYPNKRLIVHFVQPHEPFIGQKGTKLHQSGFTGGGVIRENRKNQSVYTQLAKGELSRESVISAYQENLEIVLPHVDRLIQKLSGKTVVSSDHGEAFGEYGIYGHPSGVYISPLIDIPWLTKDTGFRKKIVPEPSKTISTTSGNSSVVQNRLEDLGYLSQK